MLAIVVTSFVTSTPSSATSVTTWPVKVPNSATQQVIAHSESNLTMFECAMATQRSLVTHYRNGQLQTGQNSTYYDYCLSDISSAQGATMEDGTSYYWDSDGGQYYIVAQKNGVEMWRINMVHPNDCASWISGKQSGEMNFQSVSIGADGLLYGLIVPTAYAGQPNCFERLVAIDRKTGQIVKDIPIGSGPQPGNGDYPVPSRVWTYEDKILVVDRSGLVRTFRYDFSEIALLQYQLPLATGAIVNAVTADSAGNLFAIQYGARQPYVRPLLYRLATGAAGSIDYSGDSNYLQPDGEGGAELIDHVARKVIRFNTTTNTAEEFQPEVPQVSGYPTPTFSGYARDDQGNRLVSWMYIQGDNAAYRLAKYDSSGNLTIVFSGGKVIGDATTSNLMIMSSQVMGVGITGGNLYTSSCVNKTPSWCWDEATQNPERYIQKIALPGFGAPVYEKTGYEEYTDTRKQYVAMGDSFSSGEGVEPFLPGTDISSNQCHRSANAYPMLLDKDQSLDLNLTAFVACSGATTDNVLYGGQHDEPAQIDALSSETDVVTLTIGGNDLGFSSIIKGCADKNSTPAGKTQEKYCEELREDAWLKLADPNFEDKLQLTLLEVRLSIASDGLVLVAGYPALIPTNPVPCTWGPGSLAFTTIPRPITMEERQDLYDLTIELNSVIENATLGLDVRYVGVVNDFLGHAVCQSEPFIRDISWPNNIEYSFHPNNDGQSKYFEKMKDAVS